MRRKKLVSILLLAVLIVTGLFATSQYPEKDILFAQEETDPYTYQIENVASASQTPILISNPYQIADIAEAANPATVYIQVKWPAEEGATLRRTDPFSFFFDFWSLQPFPYPSTNERVSQGSGFIIDSSGIVLTNQHVVGNAGEGQEITITVSSENVSGDFNATILGSDARLDLAVLQIEDDSEPFPTMVLGDSDQARQGEWVIAIGNPYGKQFDHTVTVGVLSAKEREIRIMNADQTTTTYRNLMQIDAAINSGNSGGPLLNLAGEVIGINTAVHVEAQGIGFAIPINVAKDVLQELIDTGGVALPPLPWLGIHHVNVDESLANQLRLADTKGIFIGDVVRDSPAAEAGLKPGDIIRRFGDADIEDQDDLINALYQYKPGDTVMLTVLRGNQTQLINVTIGDMPENLRD